MNTPNDDYDNPWKMAAARYFREFLAIFRPQLEAAIDWTAEPTFHDQELRQVTRDAKTGLRRLDQLVKVRLLDGGGLYIHIEVQLCRQRGFGRRMFMYNARLFDRYGCVVASNFFALMTQAHFATMLTRRAPEDRLSRKILLTSMVYAFGWPKQRILDFVDVLDWLMQVPETQKAVFEAALSELERRLDMPYVNSMVRDAIAKGEALGIEQGIERGIERGIEQGIEVGQLKGRREALAELLALRFGELPDAAKFRIERGTKDELSRWMAKTILAARLDDVLEG